MMRQWDINRQYMITEAKADLVDVWELLRSLEDTFPSRTSEWYKEKTLDLIREILELEPDISFITLEDSEWYQWQTSPQQVVEYVKEEWTKLGRRPTGAEIGWLVVWPI